MLKKYIKILKKGTDLVFFCNHFSLFLETRALSSAVAETALNNPLKSHLLMC